MGRLWDHPRGRTETVCRQVPMTGIPVGTSRAETPRGISCLCMSGITTGPTILRRSLSWRLMPVVLQTTIRNTCRRTANGTTRSPQALKLRRRRPLMVRLEWDSAGSPTARRHARRTPWKGAAESGILPPTSALRARYISARRPIPGLLGTRPIPILIRWSLLAEAKVRGRQSRPSPVEFLNNRNI